MSTLQPGGAFEVSLYDSDFFTNASNDDLKIRPMLERQRILIGTKSNADAALMITSNTVFMNNNLYLYSKLGIGKSNLFDEYPVDIVGNAAIDGSVNSTKYVLCRGLQLKKKFGSYFQTTDLPTGLVQGFSNDGVGLVMYISGGSENNYIKFLASNQDVFHIEGSGNVGVGTSNPAYKVDVIGTISTSEGVKIGSNFIWDYSNILGIDTASNVTRISIDKSNGNVGIATKTPATSLDISTTDAMRIPTGTTAQRPSTPSSGYMRYNTTTSTFEGFGGSAWGSLGGVKDTNQDTYIVAESFPTSNDDIIRFYNSNNETLRITSRGFIGVSNQAPSERLEVSGGNAKFNSNVYVLQRLGISSSNPTESFETMGNIKIKGFTYSMNSIGISTSNPTEKLEVIGNAKITNNAYVMNWMGVGTSNPTVDFEVTGSAKINTNLEVVGNMTVRGTSTTVDSQTVTIKDNIIRVNNGATYISSLQAGIEINRGAGYSNYYFIYDEPTTLFKIGQPQSLQAVATREDTPPDTTIPFYSATNSRYSSCNYLVFNAGKLGVGLQYPQEAIHVDGAVKISTGQIINVPGHFTTPGTMVFNTSNANFLFRKIATDSNVNSYTDLALLNHSNLTVYGNSYTSGRLGVGTTAPTQNVHIYGNLPTLLMQNSSLVNGNTQLRFLHSNGTLLTELGVSWQSNVFIANKQNGVISFETNSIQRMLITSNGNVGVGANNPISLLNVDGGGYSTNAFPTYGHLVVNYSNNGGMGGTMTLRNSGGASTIGSKAGIAFELDNSTSFNADGTDAANAAIYGVLEAANNAGAITFNTWSGSANGERARISSAGVIVNGTTALSGAQLTVNSKLFVGASTNGGNYTDAIIHIAKSSAAPSMTLEYNNVGTGHLRLESNLFRWVADGTYSFDIANNVTNTNPTGSGTSLMRITGTGDVGIGTTTPATKLQVSGTISGTSLVLGNVLDTTRYIAAYNSNLGTNTGDKAVFVCGKSGTTWNQFECSYYHVADDSSANYLTIGNWSRKLFNFTTGGRLGIGTTTPLFQLHNALGSVFIGDIAYASNVIPSFAPAITPANGYRLVFDNTYNITAGAGMAANKIVLHNNNFLCGFGIENNAVTYHSGGNHTFYVSTNNTSTYGTSAMIINSSGNVGIGTTSPSYLLDVNGTGRVAGNLMATTSHTLASSNYTIWGAAIPTSSVTNSNNVNLMISGGMTYPPNNPGVSTWANGVVIFKGGDIGGGVWGWGNSTSYYGSDTIIAGGNVSIGSGNNGSATVYGYGGNVKFYPGWSATRNNTFGTPVNRGGETIFYYATTNGGTIANLGFNSYGDPTSFYTGAFTSNVYAEAMRVNNLGNIGIGTSSPSGRFHVKGATSGGTPAQGYLDSTNVPLYIEDTGMIRVVYKSGASGESVVHNFEPTKNVFWGEVTDTGGYYFRGKNLYLENGKLGIGTTSPSTPLHVSTSGSGPSTNGIYCYNPNNSAGQEAVVAIRVAGPAAGNPYVSWDIAGEAGWAMGIDNADANKFKIGADWSTLTANTRLTIDRSSGNLGLGTNNPSYKLHVSGDIYQDRIYLNDGYWLVRQGYDVNNYNWDSYPCIVSYNKSGEFRVHGGGAYSLAIRCDGGYLSFTGCHEAFRILPESCIGLIVIANGRHITETKEGIFFDQITVMDALPEIDICTKKKDKRVYGVLSEIKYHGKESNASFKKSCKVNSLGEGGIWVTNTNGSLENGDYITSSDVHGYGEKQDECFICNYTVAKITQDCDFNPQLIKRQKARMTDNHVLYDENGKLIGDICKNENGQDIYDLEYPIRYVRKDGSIITKVEYDDAMVANEEVYTAAFVGCTYHCG